MLLGSSLAHDFDLIHFQVGSEGRDENIARKLLRLATSPLVLTVHLLRQRPDIVHMNTSLGQRAYWRDLVYIGIAKLLGQKVVNQIRGGALRASTAVIVLSREELVTYRSFDNHLSVHFARPTDTGKMADALACLDRDRSAMARMAVAGRARIRSQYTTTRLAEDFRRLYLSL